MLNPLKSLRNRFSFSEKKHLIGLDSRCSKLRVWAAFHTAIMAHSKWEYVKAFETDDTLLPNCWAVARIDGRGFHKLAKKHEWKRPNDIRALDLMNQAARQVMLEYNDIILGYGQSDEYSFVFRREAEIFQRRSAKVITTLVSKFSSAFVYHWHEYFPDQKLQYPPSFDGRIILYPTDRNLRDYLCWRQADCHINNLYNTTFWALVQQGKMGNNEAQQRLSGTLSGDKNEILFSQFGINYNNEPEIFRKGTVFVQKPRSTKIPRKAHKENKKREPELPVHELSLSENIVQLTCDIIGDQFWKEYPHLIPTGETTGERQDSEAKLIGNAHAQQATAPQQNQPDSQSRQKKILKIIDPCTGKLVI